MLIPHEKREIDDFDDEEFLTRNWKQSKVNNFCLNLALLKENFVSNLIILTKLSQQKLEKYA